MKNVLIGVIMWLSAELYEWRLNHPPKIDHVTKRFLIWWSIAFLTTALIVCCKGE